MPGLWSALTRRKALYHEDHTPEGGIMTSEPADESSEGGGGLSKSLSVWDIIAYGLGSTVGAGLFVVTGRAARVFAGPAVIPSFVLAGVSCLFSALCYAELASAIPVSGSAYSYTYITLGEAAAWFIGWNLTLEYGVSASAVARGWASYAASFFQAIGAPLPAALHGLPLFPGTILKSLSPLAAILCLLCTLILLMGVKESSRLNLAVTIVNMAVILFIVAAGAGSIQRANWTPFAPHGAPGVLAGASYVFFSYIGFDTVCTLGEECRNPQRDMPVGIIGSLGLVTALYIVVSLVLTGMVPSHDIDTLAPLATAFAEVGMHWATRLVALGSVTILTATTFCSLFGQPRIFLSMARDGLLPPRLANVDPRTHVPAFGTVFAGSMSAILAFLLDIDTLTDVISIGTLSAFIVVCIAVLTLRYCPPMPQPPTSADSPGARWSLESGTSADAAATFLAPDDARDGPSVRSPAPHLAALRALRAHEAPVPFAAVPSSHWGARLRRAMRAVPNEWWIAAFTAGAFLTNLGAKVSVPVADDASAAPRVSESTLWPLWVVIPLGVSLVIPVFALWVNYGEGVPVGEVEAAGALAEARQTPNIEFTRQLGSSPPSTPPIHHFQAAAASHATDGAADAAKGPSAHLRSRSGTPPVPRPASASGVLDARAAGAEGADGADTSPSGLDMGTSGPLHARHVVAGWARASGGDAEAQVASRGADYRGAEADTVGLLGRGRMDSAGGGVGAGGGAGGAALGKPGHVGDRSSAFRGGPGSVDGIGSDGVGVSAGLSHSQLEC